MDIESILSRFSSDLNLIDNSSKFILMIQSDLYKSLIVGSNVPSDNFEINKFISMLSDFIKSVLSNKSDPRLEVVVKILCVAVKLVDAMQESDLDKFKKFINGDVSELTNDDIINLLTNLTYGK